MTCLLKSHGMWGFIDGTIRNPLENGDSEEDEESEATFEGKYGEWKRSDMVVKGWIFGSLSEYVMDNVSRLKTAKRVWDYLKFLYVSGPAERAYTRYPDLNGEIHYPYPSHVHTSSFLSVKLVGKSNYQVWHEQIWCLLKSHDMLGFIDESMKCEYRALQVKGERREWERSDTLVKGWIFGSLSEDVMGTVVGLDTAKDVWLKLITTYHLSGPPTNLVDPLNTRTGDKGNVAGSGEQVQHYPYPSHVHMSSFVSVKLVGKTNYDLWEAQISCLLESLDMKGFIDGTIKNPMDIGDSKRKASEASYGEWMRSDRLVKGWIFGSLSEDVMATVVSLKTASNVWEKLMDTYWPRSRPRTSLVDPLNTRTGDKDLAEYLPLRRAIQTDDWEKFQELVNRDEIPLTKTLTETGETALHLAIQSGASLQFVQNLLNEIDPRQLPILRDVSLANPAHCAALVDNTDIAEMLVAKNPRVLFTYDNYGLLPIHTAIRLRHKKTFLYLLEASKQHISLASNHSPFGFFNRRVSTYDIIGKVLGDHISGGGDPFVGMHGTKLVYNVIEAGFVDIAFELIKEYPDIVGFGKAPPVIEAAAFSHLHYSGTKYNFFQRLVYSYVPIEKSDNTQKVQDVESQDMDEDKFVIKCRSRFHAVMEFMGVIFWKTLVHVPLVKHLKEDKVKHYTALMLLKFMCEEISKLNRVELIWKHYSRAVTVAAKNNTREPIEEIAKYFPQIAALDIEGYSIIETAVLNRSEQVYNLMVYQLNIEKSSLNTRIDKNGNNLLHLAGQLAPKDKLDEVSGAALQMQRELQWFQEVQEVIQPEMKNDKNHKNETPLMMFRREHKELRKEGEEWMKKTADSYTITTALIITMVFAAAITVPGGNNSDTGKAVYVKKPIFIIFAVSDAISMLTATTSLLFFQSILTARYAEEDFLYRLPKRLILGLVSLFFSVASMMVAFITSLYILIGHGKPGILIIIAVFGCLPVASIVALQLPLFVELISSTYGRGIFGKYVRRISSRHGLLQACLTHISSGTKRLMMRNMAN